MARALSWGGGKIRSRGEPKPNQEGRAKPARPSSRFYMPKASAPKLHQRNGGKTNGILYAARQTPSAAGSEVRGSALQPASARKPSGHKQWPKGFGPISSEPAPSHRPWASASGATPQRTCIERGRCPARTRTRMQPRTSAPDAEASVSTSLPTRSLPKEDLNIPRQPVDRRRGSQPRYGDLGCPRLGCDPSQIEFRLRQGGNASRARSLSYVTQRYPFRLPG